MIKNFTRLVILLFVLIGFAPSAHAQGGSQKFTISGYIKDLSNGESLLAASVYIVELAKGTNTNEYGFYSITLPADTYTVRINYVGLQTVERKIELNRDVRLYV